ncbi:alpha/beta fold hydrolase [Aeromicrobium sp.]|uniref:alpha/beta hydrolase n=1 Tax=Aeromicrobium sp. TaxID=1871063 RepID=UPI0030C02750
MTSTTSSPVVPGTEPFSADGGPVGVLLSHGFTGSPASMVPWGRHLAGLGHTVRVPRLPGHGTTWQDLNTTRWQDWYGELDAALTDLRSTCAHVVVAGLSMGGSLALSLAEQRPDDVDAIVLVNPAVNVARLDVKLVPALQWIVPAMPGVANDIKKPGQDEIGYDKTPLKALASLLRTWKVIRTDLPSVTQPLLLFRSDDDHVVDASSKDIVLSGVSSTIKEFVALQNSYHVATIDNDAQLIFDRTAAFIAEHVGASRD